MNKILSNIKKKKERFTSNLIYPFSGVTKECTSAKDNDNPKKVKHWL